MNKSLLLFAVLAGALTSGVATSQTRFLKVHAPEVVDRMNEPQSQESLPSKVLNDANKKGDSEKREWDQAPRDEILPHGLRLQAT